MVNATHAASSDFHTDLPVVVSAAGLVHATTGAFLGDRAGMEMFGWEFTPVRPLLEVLQDHVAAMQASRQQPAGGRCTEHPAYEPDYCPLCGTARVIGTGR